MDWVSSPSSSPCSGATAGAKSPGASRAIMVAAKAGSRGFPTRPCTRPAPARSRRCSDRPAARSSSRAARRSRSRPGRSRARQDFVLKEAPMTTAFFNEEHERPVGPTFIFSPGVNAPEGGAIKRLDSARVVPARLGRRRARLRVPGRRGRRRRGLGAHALAVRRRQADRRPRGRRAAGRQRLPPAVRAFESGSQVVGQKN